MKFIVTKFKENVRDFDYFTDEEDAKEVIESLKKTPFRITKKNFRVGQGQGMKTSFLGLYVDGVNQASDFQKLQDAIGKYILDFNYPHLGGGSLVADKKTGTIIVR